MSSHIRLIRDGSVLPDDLPIFASPAFLSCKNSDYGWFASDDFLLPFVIDKHLCFRRMIFTAETVHLRRNLTNDHEQQFLEEVIQMCVRGAPEPVDLIAAPQANAVFRVVPQQSQSIAWGSYVVDLTLDEEKIFGQFHSKHKNVIRKARADGVTIAKTANVPVIYNSLRETMRRQNLLFFPSQTYLNCLRTRLDNSVTFYTATYQNELQGTAVVIHNRRGAFYYYGGSTRTPHGGSLNLMQYEIMRDLKSKGIPVYDLMGARLTTSDPKIEGIQRFKSRFASSMRVGYTFRVVLRPVKHRIFSYAVKSYFRLRQSRYLGDVIDQSGVVRQDETTGPEMATS